MSKHTPGPWQVFEHSWSDTSVCAQNFDHAICALDINHATEESQAADAAVMAANARLIAAAPDLLEALELCYEHCRLYHPEVERNNVGETVRAAIAKATGEAA